MIESDLMRLWAVSSCEFVAEGADPSEARTAIIIDAASRVERATVLSVLGLLIEATGIEEIIDDLTVEEDAFVLFELRQSLAWLHGAEVSEGHWLYGMRQDGEAATT